MMLASTSSALLATYLRNPDDPSQKPQGPQSCGQKPADRSKLTVRMHMRRFTRLTNAFSKNVENHAAAIALHTMYYNFVRIHQTLRMTPAMAAGVTDKLWEVSDIVAMLEQWELSLARNENGPDAVWISYSDLNVCFLKISLPG